MRFIALLLALVLVLPSISTAKSSKPKTGSVKGTVHKNSSSGPDLSGVKVKCDGKSDTTNSKGKFTIDGISPGGHEITFSKSGYETYKGRVEVSSGKTANVGDRWLVEESHSSPQPKCPSGNGLYCGDPGKGQDPDHLYQCKDGKYTEKSDCSNNGCQNNGAGRDDSCKPPQHNQPPDPPSGKCPNGNGLYCGEPGKGQDPNHLYQCKDGKYNEKSPCDYGCQNNGVGKDDSCKPKNSLPGNPGKAWAPSQIDCPVSGDGWTNATGSSLHAPGKGIGGANDTYAFDLNKNGDADAGKPVYAVARGEIFTGNGWGGKSYGQILLNHTESDGRQWSSGYLHLVNIKKTSGTMEKGDIIGYIGHTSVASGIPNHLHFAVYKGHDGKQSVPVSLSCLKPQTNVGKCPNGNGIYCGDPGKGQDPNHLYQCKDGKYAEKSPCSNGCQSNGAGKDDICKPPASHSPMTGSVKGKVHSGSISGPALSGVNVTCAGKSATTGSDGTFRIDGITEGRQTIEFSKSGYQPYPGQVDITAGAIASVGDRWLEMESLQNLKKWQIDVINKLLPLENQMYFYPGGNKCENGKGYTWCYAFAREMLGVNKQYKRAIDAYNNLPGVIKATDFSSIPIGSIVFWDANSHNAYLGHAAIKINSIEVMGQGSRGLNNHKECQVTRDAYKKIPGKVIGYYSLQQ